MLKDRRGGGGGVYSYTETHLNFLSTKNQTKMTKLSTFFVKKTHYYMIDKLQIKLGKFSSHTNYNTSNSRKIKWSQ